MTKTTLDKAKRMAFEDGMSLSGWLDLLAREEQQRRDARKAGEQ